MFLPLSRCQIKLVWSGSGLMDICISVKGLSLCFYKREILYSKSIIHLKAKKCKKKNISLNAGVIHLFSKDYSSIQERRNQVMNKQMNFGSIVLFKVLIHFQPLHHTTGQHAVRLPPFIVLEKQKNVHKMQKTQNELMEQIQYNK